MVSSEKKTNKNNILLHAFSYVWDDQKKNVIEKSNAGSQMVYKSLATMLASGSLTSPCLREFPHQGMKCAVPSRVNESTTIWNVNIDLIGRIMSYKKLAGDVSKIDPGLVTFKGPVDLKCT